MRRGRVPAYGSFDHGYITTTGRGTAVFVGRAAVAVVLSVVAAGAFAAVGNAQGSGGLPADVSMSGSASNTTFVGAARAGGAMLSPSASAGDLLATGYGAFEVVGSTNIPEPGALLSNGLVTATFVAKSAASSRLTSAGTGLAQFGGLGLSSGSGALSSIGTGLMNVVGAAKSSQPVSMLGVAIGNFVGVTGFKAAASMTGAATASFVGSVGSGGTITVIQQGGETDDNAASTVRVLASNVTAGNKVVVMVFRYAQTTDDPFAAGDLTKSAGTATIGSPALVIGSNFSPGTDFINVGIWAVDVTGSGSLTVSVAGNAGDYWGIACIEINSSSGWDGSYIEATAVENDEFDSSQPVSTGNMNSAGKAIFLGVTAPGGNYSTEGVTEDAAFTLVYEEENNIAHQAGSTIYRIVAVGTTDACEWTWGSATEHLAIGAVIKGA